MNYFELARRNLARNARRSLVTVLSIAFGVAAMAVFAGYAKAVYWSLRNMAIHGEMLGQLSLSQPDGDIYRKRDPHRFLIPEQELARVREVTRHLFPEATVIPRMGIEGLVSNGVSSAIFVAQGINAQDLKTLLGPLGAMYRGLSTDKPIGVSIAEGLGRMMGLSVGSTGAVLVNTIDGQANASDVEIVDLVNTGNVATNDKAMLMPIELARSLKNVGHAAEGITILLDKVDSARNRDEGIRSLYTHPSREEGAVEEAKAQIEKALHAEGIHLEVRTWRDLSVYYNQVKRMYDVIFSVFLGIVVSIVALSITNATSMNVVERTREVGTLRAMGLRRRGVLKLFAAEVLLLVVMGSALGILCGVLAGWAITSADIRYVPPGYSIAVPVYINFDIGRTLLAIGVLGVFALAAAYFPIRRAARRPIVESLIYA